jgi:AAA+ superfamily predicted ATPase
MDRFATANSLPSILYLSHKLGLSHFECQILHLCLAFELDSRIASLCGSLQSSPSRPYPTFALAMEVLPDPHWSALSEEGPLRKYQLVDLRFEQATPLIACELRLNETILHIARDAASLSPPVQQTLTPVPLPSDNPDELHSLEQTLTKVAKTISDGDGKRVIVQFLGTRIDACHAASRLSEALHRNLYELRTDFIPQAANDLQAFSNLWIRDCLVFDLMFFIAEIDRHSVSELTQIRRFLTATNDAPSVFCIATREKLDLQVEHEIVVELPASDAKSQRKMWLSILPEGISERHTLAGQLSQQFDLVPNLAKQIVASVPIDEPQYAQSIRHQCLLACRPDLQGLAQRIDCHATWNDLVLPEESGRLLRQVVDHVNFRHRVYDDWRLAEQMNRGMGISVLFAGDSGTGKTMAAEVIANALGLDLYRIDLSSVVNKYIGETEKHLRKLFDAFESCGAVLFFDECDAIFGKRTEVKDSHDRYANIEINYLLQRLESYRGVAILATNRRSAIDSAFLRRLRFVINFPMPDSAIREDIWRRHLGGGDTPHSPSEVESGQRLPTGNLDFERLGHFPLSGGNIQSVVLNAAFRAAARSVDAVIEMQDLLAATRDEYIKLDRPINESHFQLEPPPNPRSPGRITI